MKHAIRQVVLVGGAVLLSACGGGGGGESASTTSTIAPATTIATPGLTVKANAIANAQGRMLVITVFEGAQNSGPLVGTACAQVDADPFSGAVVVSTAAPDNPCDHGAPYGVALSQEGTYSYNAGIYVPGEQRPERCATGQVTVNGPTELAVTGADFKDNCQSP